MYLAGHQSFGLFVLLNMVESFISAKMVMRKWFVQIRQQLPEGTSAGLALQYFCKMHMVGRMCMYKYVYDHIYDTLATRRPSLTFHWGIFKHIYMYIYKCLFLFLISHKHINTRTHGALFNSTSLHTVKKHFMTSIYIHVCLLLFLLLISRKQINTPMQGELFNSTSLHSKPALDHIPLLPCRWFKIRTCTKKTYIQDSVSRIQGSFERI